MTAQKGSDFLLKVGDGGDPETFTTVAGMRTTGFALGNQIFESTNVETGVWRSLQANAGTRLLTVSASGLSTDEPAQDLVETQAFANAITNFELHFTNGNVVSGPFQIRSYNKSGDENDAETLSLTLESAGEITFS